MSLAKQYAHDPPSRPTWMREEGDMIHHQIRGKNLAMAAGASAQPGGSTSLRGDKLVSHITLPLLSHLLQEQSCYGRALGGLKCQQSMQLRRRALQLDSPNI